MKFFDSCIRHVTLADVAEDIANDLCFEKYLQKLCANRERAQAYIANKNKEKTIYDEKTCNCRKTICWDVYRFCPRCQRP